MCCVVIRWVVVIPGMKLVVTLVAVLQNNKQLEINEQHVHKAVLPLAVTNVHKLLYMNKNSCLLVLCKLNPKGFVDSLTQYVLY